MLNSFLGVFGLRLAPKTLRASVESFDALRTTPENENHWTMAAGRSPNSEVSAEVRRVARNRARHEVKNNCYARGMIVTLANDTIGRGPRIQMLDKSQKDLELAWRDWCRSVRLAQKLRTARAVKATDGEVFLRLVNDKRRSKVQLDVRLYEADQIAAPWWSVDQYSNEDRYVDGIEMDSYGTPLWYHVLDQHPYGQYAGSLTSPGTGRWVSESLMIHLYREDRAGQRRGLPEIQPALPLYAMLRRYTLAVVAAAETAADIAGVVKTDAGALTADDLQAVDPGVQFPIRRRTLLTLPFGWEMQQLKAEQPTTTYREFHDAILNEIARCLNMPFNVAAGNSASYNYASGRLDHQTYHRAIDVERAEIEEYCLEKIFSAWLREYLGEASGIRPSDVDTSKYRHRWYWDPHPHVDPEKEARAVTLLWDKGLVSDTDYWLESGKDPEEQYDLLADAAKRRAELELPRPGIATQQIDMENEDGQQGSETQSQTAKGERNPKRP